MGNLKIREGKKKEVGRVFGTEPNFILLGLLGTCDSDYRYPITTCQRKHRVRFKTLSSRNWCSCRVFGLLQSFYYI